MGPVAWGIRIGTRTVPAQYHLSTGVRLEPVTTLEEHSSGILSISIYLAKREKHGAMTTLGSGHYPARYPPTPLTGPRSSIPTNEFSGSDARSGPIANEQMGRLRHSHGGWTRSLYMVGEEIERL